MSESLAAMLKRLDACEKAREWAAGHRTLGAAWKACDRGDWMLWIAAKAELCTWEELVLAACRCARLALPLVKSGDGRPLAAIEAAEGWARGETDIEAVRKAARAANAAYAAAYAAYSAANAAAYAANAAANAAAYAAYSAANAAAYAAYFAAYSAAYAAYSAANAAAYAAYSAANAAAYAAANTAALSTCADLVRHLYKAPRRRTTKLAKAKR